MKAEPLFVSFVEAQTALSLFMNSSVSGHGGQAVGELCVCRRSISQSQAEVVRCCWQGIQLDSPRDDWQLTWGGS